MGTEVARAMQSGIVLPADADWVDPAEDRVPKKTILLADDTDFFIELEKTFFRREEFDFVTAHDGAEVLGLLDAIVPDIIFLDLYMPIMGGDECCRWIKDDERLKNVPVIMVTVSGRQHDLDRCLAAGCDDIILKPLDRRHFVEIARKHLHVTVRSLIRYIARLQIRYGHTPGQFLCDYTINLSTGGVFLETTSLMAEDTPLDAEFVLPFHTDPIRCRARVAWVNDPDCPKNSRLPTGMGLQFLDLTEDDVHAIRTYIINEQLDPLW